MVTDLLLYREILDIVTSLLIGLWEEHNTFTVQYLPPRVAFPTPFLCFQKAYIAPQASDRNKLP